MSCKCHQYLFPEDFLAVYRSQEVESTTYTKKEIVTHCVQAMDQLLHSKELDNWEKRYLTHSVLILSLLSELPDNYIIQIMKICQEAHSYHNVTKEYALCIAATRSSPLLVYNLIQLGTYLNTTTRYGWTPLHFAAKTNRLAIVKMLIEHGANPKIIAPDNHSPFLKALGESHIEVAKELLRYYKQIPETMTAESRDDCYKYFINLLKINNSVLITDEKYENLARKAELFQLIYEKIEVTVLKDRQVPFLMTYLEDCMYDNHDWIKNLYMILNSPIISVLIKPLRYASLCNRFYSILTVVLQKLSKKSIEKRHRIRIIKIFLNLDIAFRKGDVNYCLRYFGFGKELEILLEGISEDTTAPAHDLPLTTFILCLEHNNDPEFVVQLIKTQIQEKKHYRMIWNVKAKHNFYNFFSLPAYAKKDLMAYAKENTELCRKIKGMCEVPSLVELCRNKIRSYLKNECKIEIPKKFHETVKLLQITEIAKSIIIFKSPIYIQDEEI